MAFLSVDRIESKVPTEPNFYAGFYPKPPASANKNRNTANGRSSIRRFLGVSDICPLEQAHPTPQHRGT
jgi:hypothetical protein